MIERALPDAAERRRIREDLDTSLFVEAGAGAGKTTALVERMLALLETGRAEVDRIAAVTFTRKAAGELRERFQTRLEARLGEAREAGDADIAATLDAALRGIDGAFIGTIHSFCGRLLRERPVDAGLDPGFRELIDPELEEVRRRFWHRWLEERQVDEDAALVDLSDVGIRPIELYDAYRKIDDNPDVDFPAVIVDPPDADPIRSELEALLEEASDALPDREPDGGWDSLQAKVRKLRFLRWVVGWEDDAAFFDALGEVVGWKGSVTKKRWPDGDLGADLLERFRAFGQPDGEAAAAIERWWAHRYRHVLGFAGRAAAAFAADRRRVGRLTFQDLLMEAARLLRESPSARRDLGERYRWLLVDEFQDTDPIQAEVVFLLTADDPDETDWRRAVPRSGALFVVGDPKQSIYRFRRADIVVYQRARLRFEALSETGRTDVVELVANFRSGPDVEKFVNEEFERRFPREATVSQAAFAPLLVQRDAAPDQGVWLYEVHPPDSKDADAVARADAEAVAGWIQGRIERGERAPGEFLLLPYRRDWLNVYVDALEARNVPVEVTGADMAIPEEAAELRLLLRALLDPDDPTLTVATLVGLFFGLDWETLTSHALAGGSFRFLHVDGQPEGPVRDALETLRGWCRTARRAPADIVVETLVAELGLLPFAAAGELGAPRSGSLAFLLEAVRSAALDGDTSLRGAIDAIDVAVEMQEAETPLQPGRDDVVRVMNLHRAKGTQAPVVVLAHPTGDPDIPPDLHVHRAPDGSATGFLHVQVREGMYNRRTIARPLDWEERQRIEEEFGEAEDDRLLYVAATRAMDELVVGRCPATIPKSFWAPFYECLDRDWKRLELGGPPRPERATLKRSAAEIAAEIEAVEADRAGRRARSYTAEAASGLAKAGAEAALERGSGGRGREWGSAVHAALEAAVRGLEGEELRAACRGALVAHERPLDADGAPRELDDLVDLVESIRASEIFGRARAADPCLAEVPFAWRREVDGEVQIVEGVVDLAFREPGGWVLVDWKTDEIEDAEVLAARQAAYECQLEIYAAAWEALTGEPVVGRELCFTANGHEEGRT